jgi:sugar phosphate isomerase/epimerase
MLYSVRDACESDLEGVLRRAAAIGYEGVELHSLYGQPAERVRGWLDELGLVAVARHAGLEALEGDLPALARELEVLGTSRLVLAWIEPPTSAADADATLGRLERIAAAAEPLGLEIGFHNHDAEVAPLEDGRSFLDRALALDVFLELDLGWIWWAGHDPVELLRSSGGRVPIVHVKDFAARGERGFRRVGDGAVDYDRIVPAAEGAGVEWLVVEQDETDGDPLEDAARSFDALQGLRRGS